MGWYYGKLSITIVVKTLVKSNSELHFVLHMIKNSGDWIGL